MPKAYRLSMNSMAVIMDNYAKYALHSHHGRLLLMCFFLSYFSLLSELADQYGADVASEVLAHSRSSLQLGVLPYGSGTASFAGSGTIDSFASKGS